MKCLVVIKNMTGSVFDCLARLGERGSEDDKFVDGYIFTPLPRHILAFHGFSSTDSVRIQKLGFEFT